MKRSPRRGWGSPPMVVARSACRLKWVRLAQVPAAERADALRVQALAWQPFTDCAHVMVLQGEAGLVLAWDRAMAQAHLRAAGLDPQRCRLIPEPLMRKPMNDGLQLLEAAEGFEAQLWNEGQLRASRWWPMPPDDAAWREFLRSLPGEHGESSLPQPCFQPWLRRPWASLMAGTDGVDEGRRREARMVWLGAAALALVAGFAAAQTLAVERAVAAQEQSNRSLRESLEPVLLQRERALTQAAQAEQWAAWLRAPLPVELIQHLHAALAPQQVLLRELELNGLRLRLGLQPPADMPRADLMKALQAGGWLTELVEVRADGARAALWLEGKLSGVSPSRAEPRLLPSPAPLQPADVLPTPAPAASSPPEAARQPTRPANIDDFPPPSVFEAIK